jgi:addiction module HigA family antidote
VRVPIMVRVPTHRPPPHPGEILAEDFLEPYQLTQVALADRIGVPFQRVNAIINGHRGITPDTALRLSKLFGTSPDFWLNLQQMWDLYQAMHDEEAAASHKRIEPVKV